MSKKKGLGRDIEKSIMIMDDLLSGLKKFHELPVKRGLQSNGIIDEKFGKMINDAKEKAFAVSIVVEDLKNMIKGAKPQGNKRFACQRIISKFLKQSE